MPRVSVVIPSYQHAPFVRQCIQSVLDQSFQDFEVLVTDDGSRDGTPDIVRSFSDRRIKLEVFAENRGACVATNAAIARATGDYVAILNSDDYWLPEKLSKQVRHLDANPRFAAVFALPKLVDERGRVLPLHPLNAIFRARTESRAWWLRHFFFKGNCLCHPTVLARRECYSELGGYDEGLAQLPDFDMWVRLASRYDFDVLPDYLTGFRILDREANASAPRPEVLVREMWEYGRILKRYERLSRCDFRAAFAPDLERLGIDTAPQLVALGRLALTGARPCHKAFGLDLLSEAVAAGLPTVDGKELSRMAGEHDIYCVRSRKRLRMCLEKLLLKYGPTRGAVRLIRSLRR